MSLASRSSSRRFAASAIPSAIRNRWKLRTVPGRLTFWYVGTLAVSLGAFATFVLIVSASSLRAELDATLAARATAVATAITPLLDRSHLTGVLEAVSDAQSTPYTVRRADGSVAFRSLAVPAVPETWERALVAGAANGLPFQTIRTTTGEDLRVFNLFLTGPSGAKYVLQLTSPTARVRQAVGRLALVQMFGILLVLAAARYGSAFTARRALAPIDEIIKRGRDIQGHAPGRRLEVAADTIEIERLVETLNQMLARLEEPVHTAQRFAAVVSHELQTPIAAMRFALEAAQRGDRPAQYYREIAGDVLVELDRLTTLIRDLRLLAVAGSGQLFTTAEPIDVTELAQQCCEIARAIAEDKRIHIEDRLTPGLMVSGSALHLRRVVLNLAENAIRYSPPDSTVRVQTAFADGCVEITISDEGCGISADDLPRIFEPFFRADRARARETGGSGLGLAIADQVVRAHQGRILVTSEINKGSTFCVVVPGTAAAPAHGDVTVENSGKDERVLTGVSWTAHLQHP
jgi:signal transduction histidine kinase